MLFKTFVMVACVTFCFLGCPSALEASQCTGSIDYMDAHDWNAAAQVANCYYERHQWDDAEKWYVDSITQLGYNKNLPAEERRKRAYLNYHYAIAMMHLKNSLNRVSWNDSDPVALALLSALDDSDDPKIVDALRRRNPTVYGTYRKLKETDAQDNRNIQKEKSLDDLASAEEREQFEFWDRLTPDQQDAISAEGGTRRSNSDARPCHTEYYDAPDYHKVTWWYCNEPVDGNRTYRKAYTFVNGKLDSTFSP